VLGGGPAVRAVVDREFDRLTLVRWVLLNGGLLVALLPVPGDVRRIALAIVMVTVLTLVPLLLRGIVAGVRAKRAAP
jgi:nitrite reductase (NO-forming)